jgi:hypothetical protein
MNWKLILVFSLIFGFQCSSTPKRYLGAEDTQIDSKIVKLINLGAKIQLLVLAPKELSVTNCNFSDQIFDAILKQSNASLESQFLKLHGKNTNFKLVDRANLGYVLDEIKIQSQGLTSGQTAKIGKMTGANYLVISSASLSCSSDNRELTHTGNSKLIQIETSTTEAIDVTKLTLVYDEESKDFIFKKGFVNGRLVNFDKDRDQYSWAE